MRPPSSLSRVENSRRMAGVILPSFWSSTSEEATIVVSGDLSSVPTPERSTWRNAPPDRPRRVLLRGRGRRAGRRFGLPQTLRRLRAIENGRDAVREELSDVAMLEAERLRGLRAGRLDHGDAALLDRHGKHEHR